MNSKKWIKIWLSTMVITIAITGSINYLVDPMWLFSHQFTFNQVQGAFNERQQKTNYLQFRNSNTYNGVLLGSSRTASINQKDFVGMNVFNYAFGSMKPFEYIEYLEFFKKKHKNLNYIIIGADFLNTSIPNPKNINFEIPKYYINNTINPSYRLTTLLSVDTLRYSFINIARFLNRRDENKGAFYDRNNIRFKDKASEKQRIEAYTSNIKRQTNYFTGKNYKYNHEYISILNTLKNNNPHTNIIIFTSPISADLLVSIIKNGERLKEYRDWLYNLITEFGLIYHFMDINSITTNLKNYPDDSHYYPYIGKLVANRISDFDNQKIPNDFGIVLNKNNLDEYLNKFEKKLNLYKNPLSIIR
jgi:hypothetical protein